MHGGMAMTTRLYVGLFMQRARAGRIVIRATIVYHERIAFASLRG